MLTEKPWRLEAALRLLVGMVACVFLGSLLLTVLRFDPQKATTTPLLFYCLVVGALLALLGILGIATQPWNNRRILLLTGILIVCAYASLGLSAAAQRASGTGATNMTVMTALVGALSFQGATLPLIWLFVRQHGLTLRDAFGLQLNLRHALLLGATAALAFMPVALGLQFGIGMIAEALHFPLPTQEAVRVLRLADSWTDKLALAFMVAVLAPLAEEGLFRGILYPLIKNLGFPQLALWGSSLLFATIHMNALSFVPLLVLAVVLVKLYEKTGNLLSCIACHATFNLFNFVMLLLANKFISDLPAQQ